MVEPQMAVDKPAPLLHAWRGEFAFAVDIGGTKIALTAVDPCGRILLKPEKLLVPFASDGSADPDQILDMLKPFLEQAQRLPGKLVGIGLSCCGNIDPETGIAALAPNLHWHNLPFGMMMQQAFALPVFAATDVRMAILAEKIWGAAQNLSNFAWATLGTGYGGYLFLDGKLYDGVHRFAGNFGHMTLNERSGYPCGCGRNGCFESFVSGPGIARAGQAVAERGESPFLQAILVERTVMTRDVFAAEYAGDPGAHAILEEVLRLIAINLGGLVNTLDLEAIILGGGVVSAFPDFIPRLDQRIRDFLMTAEAIRDLRILKESFENSSLIGAAADVFLRQGIEMASIS
ncbi:MAG: ROK family protein [Chloroflexota bacterium]